MFERYTEQARRLIFFARYEASQLGSPAIDTEHLLLGLLREAQGRASTLLASRGVSLLELRAEVERSILPAAATSTSVDIPLTPAARRVLDIALEEAGRGQVNSEHLLLGLVRETEGVAGRLLRGHGF